MSDTVLPALRARPIRCFVVNNFVFCCIMVTIVSEWLKFGLDIYTSFINMCRKLKAFLLFGKKLLLFVTCFGLRLVANVLGPGKQYFAELRTDFLLSAHMIIQFSSQQVWELNFHA